MILEYAQLLSTAHRILDGTETISKSKTGRSVKRWSLDDSRDSVLYSATHVNHPSARWVRVGEQNYRWLFTLWCELLDEYTYRYGKVHSCQRLLTTLAKPPKNIPMEEPFSAPWRAMPDEFKVDDTMQSYRNYYTGAKSHMFKWKNRPQPDWIV
jgi:hypothetical protein